jgi:hypothetical protein
MQDKLMSLITGVGAEIGVWKGHGAEVILKNPSVKRVYLIDPYEKAEEFKECELKPSHFEFDTQGEYKLEAIDRTKKQSERAWFIFARSTEAAKVIDEKLDFVYIDGNHLFDYVMLDLIYWTRKVRKGGIVAGDDYAASNKGVGKAVDAYIQAHGYKLNTTKKDETATLFHTNINFWFNK